MNFIPFNKPPVVGTEKEYISNAIESGKLSGDNEYSKLCERWFRESFGAQKVLLTPSCTAALEMAAILIDIQPGDEVIVPSYTFVSTANAFALRGAKIKFVDIRPDTLNIDERKIESAITKKTKAIVPVHYAGVACAMDEIMAIAEQYGLFVIEDAAQGVMSKYNGKALGTIGHLGCFSFHETKNYTSGGEGGALIVNAPQFNERAEIIREKGTDRSLFFQGLVDKYSWRDIGSSFLPSEIQAAYLYAQLLQAETINNKRLEICKRYSEAFSEFPIKTLDIPSGVESNGHMFYIIFDNAELRGGFIKFMSDNNILCPFHYIPLHSSPAGLEFGEFVGSDVYSSDLSSRLVRLPVFYNMTSAETDWVIDKVIEYMQGI